MNHHLLQLRLRCYFHYQHLQNNHLRRLLSALHLVKQSRYYHLFHQRFVYLRRLFDSNDSMLDHQLIHHHNLHLL